MKPNIEIIEPKLFAATVADEIVACIDEAVNEHGDCSIVLSGGRTPSAVYRMMSRPPRVQDIPWEKVSLFWGDERWVPRDSDQSNYKMVEETLLSPLGSKAPSVFGIDTTLNSVEEAADTYLEVVKSKISRQSNGLPRFDIVLLGMGNDGHVASIFAPDHTAEQNTFESEARSQFCYAITHDNTKGESTARVTLSIPVLFSAERVIFIVSGERKAEIVQRVLGEGNSEGLPVDAYRSAVGKVSWFLDSAAAKLLDKN